MATLLALARKGGENKRASTSSDASWVLMDDENGGLNKFELWVEIKKQVAILREGMDDEDGKN